MNYVGIDHHRQYSHMTVKDQMGQVLRSGRVPNLQNDIGKFLEGFEAVEAVIFELALNSSQFSPISIL